MPRKGSHQFKVLANVGELKQLTHQTPFLENFPFRGKETWQYREISWLRRGAVDELFNVSRSKAMHRIQAVRWPTAMSDAINRPNGHHVSEAELAPSALPRHRSSVRQLHDCLTFLPPDVLEQPEISVGHVLDPIFLDGLGRRGQPSNPHCIRSRRRLFSSQSARRARHSRPSFQAISNRLSPSSLDPIAIVVPGL
jgi:hypothetical protein